MIILAYISVLLPYCLAINDYNYVLERYTIQPTNSLMLKTKLCRIFKSLSMCDEYNRNRDNWRIITPYSLDSYPNSLQRRQAFINKWTRDDNLAHCVCKCCTCPRRPKLKHKKLFRQRRNYKIFPKNKIREPNNKYYMPLVRRKYNYLQKRRKKRHRKRFNFGNLINTVKNTTINTYEKGFNAVKNTANLVKDTAKNTYDEVIDEVKIITGKETPLEKCIHFLKKVNKNIEVLYHNNIVAQWNYEANLTETNKNISIQSDIGFAKALQENCAEVKEFDKANNCSYINATISRQFKFLTKLQEAALPLDNYSELQNILRSMESIFSKAVVKDFENGSHSLHLEPDITNIMAHSRNPNKLRYIWESWRNETGRKLKMFYPRYIELMKKSADLNGFDNVADMWISVYEQENFEKKIYQIWEDIKPLYQQLHAYVRHKLEQFYGYEELPNQYIPAHLLGNVFGQTWINIYNITIPYPQNTFPDITTQLKSKGYTPLKMFQEAENFFKSLNLPPMTEDFWNKSILEPKSDVQMVCHASAWDMYDKKDFRIKMCTHVTFEDFIVIHHEMGHVEYYMLYKDLPVVFREGANPGFHEAIGDTIALSVSTPKHMQSLGLQINNEVTNHEHDINFLFLMALQKIAFLPYALVVDTWRWGVFRGSINLENYNRQWWNLRNKYQGIEPPNYRNEDNFDAGGKYHIAAGVPYIRYFVSFVIQFQFHEALCKATDNIKDTIPLHRCDIYKSSEAGELLKKALSLGKSVPWSEIMKNLAQSDDINAESLLKYFEPLQQWLTEENKKENTSIGWENY